MLNNVLNKILKVAMEICIEKKSEYVTLEHLLMASMSLESSEEIFTKCNIKLTNYDNMKEELENYINENENFSITKLKDYEPKVTPTIQRVMEKIIVSISMQGVSNVGLEYLLYFIVEEEKTFASFLLKKYGIDLSFFRNDNDNFREPKNYKNKDEAFQDIRNILEQRYLTEMNKDKNNNLNEINYLKQLKSNINPNSQTNLDQTNLENKIENFVINLTKQAKEYKLEKLIGREQELNEIIRVLARKKKNNPILVGEPGVGKTSIIDGLAQYIISNNDDFFNLKNYELYSVDINKLLAGTKWRGEFEERIDNLINFFEKKDKVILFIDEIHSIIESSKGHSNLAEIGNALKPFLSKGTIKLIGATTFEDFYKIEKDKAFARRFEKIEVLEPSLEETKEIIYGIKESYEKHHNVVFNKNIIDMVIKLSKKYLLEKKLPDSAISMLDDIGSKLNMKNKSNVDYIVLENDVKEIFSEITKIPKTLLLPEDSSSLEYLEKQLKDKIFGQDKAIDSLIQKVITYRAGLGDFDRPAGVFMFVGPTGSGKTELTKEIANNLSMNLIRMDMSEFMEKHSVSKIIGSPSGYVGYEEGGQFIKEVRKHPNSVILLDEIEKAHQDVLNILLQVMDYGKLKGSDGMIANFHNSIIIMTSNVGAVIEKSLGFNKETLDKTKKTKAIEDKFSPEFLNRIDTIIQFNKLEKEDSINIVDKFLNNIVLQLKEKNVELELSLLAKEFLINKGYSEKMGARPLKKVIYDEIIQNLAKEILFGKLKNGGMVKVDSNSKELLFEII